MQIEVLFEDDNFLIVNKPAGLIVHATVDKNRPNLFDILKESRGSSELSLLHRLDKDTSGAILFTKNPEVNKKIQEAFNERSIKKTYRAIVHGEWRENSGVMEDFLKKEIQKNKKELMVKVHKGGQKAITYFEVVKRSEAYSHMSFTLETGRMHQIRIQSALRGHPLLGDAFYGNSELDKKMNAQRLYLHSYKLEFEYEGTLIRAEARLPEEFLRFN
jgi:23S rRNA pseudouridine1911/1915/1917 synthase